MQHEIFDGLSLLIFPKNEHYLLYLKRKKKREKRMVFPSLFAPLEGECVGDLLLLEGDLDFCERLLLGAISWLASLGDLFSWSSFSDGSSLVGRLPPLLWGVSWPSGRRESTWTCSLLPVEVPFLEISPTWGPSGTLSSWYLGIIPWSWSCCKTSRIRTRFRWRRRIVKGRWKNWLQIEN